MDVPRYPPSRKNSINYGWDGKSVKVYRGHSYLIGAIPLGTEHPGALARRFEDYRRLHHMGTERALRHFNRKAKP